MLYKMPGMVVGHASDVVQDAGHAEKMENSVQRAGGAAAGCSGGKAGGQGKKNRCALGGRTQRYKSKAGGIRLHWKVHGVLA